MTAEPGPHRAVKMAFEAASVVVPIASLVPLKTLRPGVKSSRKYAQILGSVRAIGLVEAPVVTPDRQHLGSYLLLDGHLRVEALKDIGVAEVECLIATDDEAFTYNKRINRLAAVQEHRMVTNAVSRGVPEERIAEALGIEISAVRRRTHMLKGICPGAVDLLKTTRCQAKVFDILRCMAPARQVEAAELMIGQGNFTMAFARALLAATPQKQLLPSRQRKPMALASATAEQIGRMERELAGLQEQVRSVGETYGLDNLHLTVARGYVAKLLTNARVAGWLTQNRPEYVEEFQAIAALQTIAPG